MHILIVRNNSNVKAIDASLLLSAYLSSQGISCTLVDSSDTATLLAACGNTAYDMAIALGGDGTILRTADVVQGTRVPILGINFGRLGFLANPSDDGVVAIVAAALAGDVSEERRANLRFDVLCEGDDPNFIPCGDELLFTNEGERRSFFALNELAIGRGSSGRIVDFSLTISGAQVADMRGDGLVLATATGSTAYALSAGGPLVSPEHEGLVVVPIAPHSLNSRAIVTARGDVVEVSMEESHASRETTLFVDGEPLVFTEPVTKVFARVGSDPTVLLRYKGEGFYDRIAGVFFGRVDA